MLKLCRKEVVDYVITSKSNLKTKILAKKYRTKLYLFYKLLVKNTDAFFIHVMLNFKIQI